MKFVRLNKAEQKINRFLKEARRAYNFEFIDEVLKESDSRVYIFGGAIRDTLLGFAPKDIDILILLPYDNQRKRDNHLLNLIKPAVQIKTIVRFQKEVTVFRIIPKYSIRKKAIDVNLSKSLRYSKLDFTINDLYFDIKTGNLIDRNGGLEDLERKTLRTILKPERQFSSEPHLMFRALKIASKLDLTMDPSLLKAMQRLKNKAHVPLEYITSHRNDWSSEIHLGSLFLGLSYNPKIWWHIFNKSGLLDVFLQFVNKKIGSDSSISKIKFVKKNILSKLLNVDTLEDRMSIFLSEVTKQVCKKDKTNEGFLKTRNLLALDIPKKFGELPIDIKNIKFCDR